MANVFYIIIAFLQMIPLISITSGKPIMLLPLTFVIAVSMIKDISEDYKRHKSDRKENMSEVEALDIQSGEFVKTQW
jgi:phospholipid-transporting ATPase